MIFCIDLFCTILSVYKNLFDAETRVAFFLDFIYERFNQQLQLFFLH